MDTEIGSRGYSIPLKQLPGHFLEDIRTELNVKPLENPNFQSSEAFPVYRISKSKVYLPRHYGLEKYGPARFNNLNKYSVINVAFEGTLRDIQQETVDATLTAFENFGGGLVSLSTGLGKTVVGLNLVSRVNVKTLIVVHAEFLLDQWIERIQWYLPTARVGVIRQNKCEVEDVDITIGMIQTITKREYPKNFFDSFGLTIVDECFPSYTRILTSRGILTIGQIYNLWKEDHYITVMSYNEETQQLETKWVTHAWKKRNQNLLRFKYHEGEFDCTPNHRILTYHGYLEAKELCVGDYFNTGMDLYTRIDSIQEVFHESGDVYDIEVADNHNFKLADFGPIVHNCHHLGSKTFSSIFYKVQTKYHLGLSATPERKDGLSKVIYWFLGPQIVNIKRNTGIPSVKFLFNNIEGYEEKHNCIGKINLPEMLTDLTLKDSRNKLIVDLLIELLEQNRKILVLTHRRAHCEMLLQMLPEGLAGVYLGGMKKKDRDTSKKQRIILGTYQASGEGFDLLELDTLIMATPKSDVDQAIGRILRQKNVNDPVIYDIVDSFSVFKGQYYKRRKFYKDNNIQFK
jgi:superfamily II DNA or RNA helicase